MEERRAISPIIATLLLIIIVVGIGVALYSYVMGYTGASTKIVDAAITEAYAYNEPAVLVVNVRNTGTIAIKEIKVFYDGKEVTGNYWTPAISASNPLVAGQTAVFRANMTEAGVPVGAQGTIHTVEIQATGVDGSPVIRTTTITVK